jgi:hypothetical protein
MSNFTQEQCDNATIKRTLKGDHWVIEITDENGYEYPKFIDFDSATDITLADHKTAMHTFMKANCEFYVAPTTETYGTTETL